MQPVVIKVGHLREAAPHNWLLLHSGPVVAEHGNLLWLRSQTCLIVKDGHSVCAAAAAAAAMTAAFDAVIGTADDLLQRKQKLAVGIYVVRKAITDTGLVRNKLHASCTAHPDMCTHITWDMSHNLSSKAQAYDNYSTHYYCMQPPGDWILRGAFYDCVVAGGIPVVFHPDYAKMVAFSDMFDYTQMLSQAPTPAELEKSGSEYLQHLQQQHTSSNSTVKLQALHPLRRLFQYAVNPDHYLIDWARRGKVDARDDAFTFSLKAMLRGLCNQTTFSKGPQCLQPSAS
jgi:hypothetical protein